MAKNIKIKKGLISFNLIINNVFYKKVKFNTFCKHNIYNFLASICVAYCLNLNINTAINNIIKFKGVKRRCEYIGEYYSNKIYADYAHHPKEIESVLKTFKKTFKNKNLLVIFQPHTYSRTKLLFKDFLKVLSKYNLKIFKTFPARETEDKGYSGEILSQKLKVDYLSREEDIKNILKNSYKKTIIFIGAGDIYSIVKEIIS